MNLINDIVSDFFNCCNLPILAVDMDFNVISKEGYNSTLQQIFDRHDIYRDIRMSSPDFLSLNLSYKNDINFVVASISRFNKYRGYFIIGPFNCENNTNNYIPFKPKSCIGYMSSIILNISDDKFSKGMSNLRFNIHVKKAIQYIHENYMNSINLNELCNDLNVNKSYFCKVFKKETSFTFSDFLNSFRIEKSKHLLKSTNLSLLDIAVSVGFNTQNYFTIVFKKFIHKSPLEYRNSIAMN